LKEGKEMTDCARCKSLIIISDFEIQSHLPPTLTGYGVGNYLCYNCYKELIEEYKKENKKPEIECPNCGQKFILVVKKPHKTEELSLPWALIKRGKNEPFFHCPHCQMKLPSDEIVD
jgi:DNA-directed RNA polymerase subunit RPC12/RpoP